MSLRIPPSFSLRHLIAFTIATTIAVSGKVSIGKIAFVLFLLIYTYFLSLKIFPVLPPPPNKNKPNPPLINYKSTLFRAYALFSAIIGLLLPIIYAIDAIIRGDKQSINSPSTSHLFLMCSQVFMEGLFYWGEFSLPIWVFVAVVTHPVRIFILFEWVDFEISRLDQGWGYDGGMIRVYFGIGLACVNLGFWCYNLFGFLLPVFLPRCFGRYYCNMELLKQG